MSANAEIIAELRRVLNERDEARAALAACPDCAMYAERARRFAEQADQMQRERDEARASVADAYRRGAEAMREACQQWCRAWENNGEAIADALADLRVEDKP